MNWGGWCGDIRSTGDGYFPIPVGGAGVAVPVNRRAGQWLAWLLAAASLSGAAGCGREPLAAAPAHDGSSVGAPPGPTLAGDAGVPVPDAAGQATDAGGAAGAPPPLAYVRACDAGLTRAASYTLVPDGVQTAYHRCGELGEVARGVRISRDGRRLAVIAAESVRLFDTATWREIARVAHAAEPVDAAAFSPDGTRLATVSSYIGQVALWDTSDGHSVAIFPGTVASPGTSQLARGTGVAFSSDGRRIATSMGTIIDTATGSFTNVGNNVIRNGQNIDLWFTADDSGLVGRDGHRALRRRHGRASGRGRRPAVRRPHPVRRFRRPMEPGVLRGGRQPAYPGQ